MDRTPFRARPARGFTLIELLVALAVMALLALVSWRGLDGMSRATTQNQLRADAVLTLQTTLAQWSADLDAVVALAQTRPIDWDGRVLRLTRSGGDAANPSVLVVAWTLRAGPDGVRWRRWQSPPFSTRGAWQQAWTQAASWAQENGGAQGSYGGPNGFSDTVLIPVQNWQLYYFRNDVWVPAGELQATPANPQAPIGSIVSMPDGVRLVLTLPPGDGLSGTLTRDWVRPTVGSQRS
ncbi:MULTISPECIES: PulJ/GspJ family protein [unclassified Variovorax]|jgi:general secretion pathway protein J|uniref:PulJ/GspJ family protein n=1 Tax=unclassified Variovorax TaxID=663243 RepID=UPI0008E0075F|nr:MULTISPECIES: prepilin-type N-terminal cleavage/methylation domain-containing protein [unclassified Variovorax]TAJ63758.1 MAG: prepilin-type N-terminal cleavage/methylation domain-containing protein [Variovorax sp.]SFQ10121.1 general secretion pathway protein J [Variovorax sp. PDC80]